MRKIELNIIKISAWIMSIPNIEIVTIKEKKVI